MAVEGTSPLKLPAKLPVPVAKPDQLPATVPIPAELPPELRAQRDANKVTAPLNQPVAATAFNALPTATALNPSGDVLLRGKASDEVATLQGMLQAAGIRVDGEDVAVDRRFGPQTEAAVQAFQTQVGLTPDGKAGPNTKQALEANNLLVQAQQALATNTAEGAVRAKQLADQASAILEKLPPNEAKALREQAAGTKTQADQKAQELSQPTPEQLQQQEAEKAAADRTQKQNAATEGVDGAIAQGKTAADAADQAATRAEAAATRAANAANPTDAAKAVDQAATALNEAKQQQAQAQTALEAAKKAQAEAPDPAALAPKVAEAQAQVDRANQAVARAQGAVNQAGQAVTARVEAERKAQTEAAGKTSDEAEVSTTGNELLRHNEMAFNGALNNAMTGLQASAANNGNPQGSLQYLKDAKEALNQTRENVEGIEAAAKRAEEEAAKAPNPAALAPQVAEAKAAAEAARAKLTAMEQRYQQAEGQAQGLLTQQAGGAAQRAQLAGTAASQAAQSGQLAADQAKTATTSAQTTALQATAQKAVDDAKAQQAEAQRNLAQVAELVRQAPQGNSPELQAKLAQAQSGLEQANRAVGQAEQALQGVKNAHTQVVAAENLAANQAELAARAEQIAQQNAISAQQAAYQGANQTATTAREQTERAAQALGQAQNPQADLASRERALAQANTSIQAAGEAVVRAEAALKAGQEAGLDAGQLQQATANVEEAKHNLTQLRSDFATTQSAIQSEKQAVATPAEATEAAPVEAQAHATMTPQEAQAALDEAKRMAFPMGGGFNQVASGDMAPLRALLARPEVVAQLPAEELSKAAGQLLNTFGTQPGEQREAAQLLASQFLTEAVKKDPSGGQMGVFTGIGSLDMENARNVLARTSLQLPGPLSAQDRTSLNHAFAGTNNSDPIAVQAARAHFASAIGPNATPEAVAAAAEGFSTNGDLRRDAMAMAVLGMKENQSLAGLSTESLRAMEAALQPTGMFTWLGAGDTDDAKLAREQIQSVLSQR